MENVIQLAKKIVEVLDQANATNVEKTAAIRLAQTLSEFKLAESAASQFLPDLSVQASHSAFLGSE